MPDFLVWKVLTLSAANGMLGNMNTLGHLGYLQLLSFFAPRFLFSILCGGIVGMERELKHKPAGIKTNILICLGASLFTSTSILISELLGDYG